MAIPFDSWDGTNDFSGTIEQAKLEQFFGPSAVAFGTYQAAISAILEILGTRAHLIPVVMPVTASPDTISAVLRAGAEPFLLDIHPETLQIDPKILSEVLSELEGAVVLLTRPGGQPVSSDLLQLCEGLPSILDSRLPPHASVEKDCVCSFNVFDFAPVIGSGALVVHKFGEQVRELKMARNGILGLASNLNELLAAGALKRLKEEPDLRHRRNAQDDCAHAYMNLLKDEPFFRESPEWPYFTVEVPNADRVIAHLYANGIEAVKPVFPLHMLSEINSRWVEKPSYPVAENLWKKLVALPVHPGILGKESTIIQLLLEVSNEHLD